MPYPGTNVYIPACKKVPLAFLSGRADGGSLQAVVTNLEEEAHLAKAEA
jgi:hypothetical protein